MRLTRTWPCRHLRASCCKGISPRFWGAGSTPEIRRALRQPCLSLPSRERPEKNWNRCAARPEGAWRHPGLSCLATAFRSSLALAQGLKHIQRVRMNRLDLNPDEEGQRLLKCFLENHDGPMLYLWAEVSKPEFRLLPACYQYRC